MRPTGRLVVSAPALFGRLHVSPLMCRYLNQNPDVIGEPTLSDRVVNLIDDGIDVAVRIGHLADSSLIPRHRTIQSRPLAPVTDWSFSERGRELRVPLSSHYSTNSADAALLHAEHDGGLTFALSYQVVEAVQAGRLRLRQGKRPPLSRHVCG